ncbi:hypothetical protein [Kineosporia sp. NBRC 101731]|uniref:hypothetical protein n=1 Tax=Kineosporia sp. NBRC 101731 TaxID=3032199 RepID=UPI0024A2BDDB|nr:hypothetical protein [Kineosporia sp. NBRC 101731]GLY28927.1 hypothetical protein Kisp02_22920 [Kineosporia sp. NBRC 101731]
MGSGGSAPVIVERADNALLMRAGDTDPTCRGIVAALAPEPFTVPLVVDSSAMGALQNPAPALIGQIRDHLNVTGSGSPSDVRLVAARAARSGPGGGPAPASILADQLQVQVIAPDGALIALRGGELFSAGEDGGWLAFRRGWTPQWLGPRHPAPTWQETHYSTGWLPAVEAFSPGPSLAGRLSGTPIPAGLWVRSAGGQRKALSDLGFGVPVDRDRPLLLVGAPGEPVPTADELAGVISSLSTTWREHVVLAPYGSTGTTWLGLVQGVADRLGNAVRAHQALPYYAVDGARRLAELDRTGRPSRLRDVEEITRHPSSIAVLMSSSTGAGSVVPAPDGTATAGVSPAGASPAGALPAGSVAVGIAEVGGPAEWSAGPGSVETTPTGGPGPSVVPEADVPEATLSVAGTMSSPYTLVVDEDGVLRPVLGRPVPPTLPGDVGSPERDREAGLVAAGLTRSSVVVPMVAGVTGRPEPAQAGSGRSVTTGTTEPEPAPATSGPAVLAAGIARVPALAGVPSRPVAMTPDLVPQSDIPGDVRVLLDLTASRATKDPAAVPQLRASGSGPGNRSPILDDGARNRGLDEDLASVAQNLRELSMASAVAESDPVGPGNAATVPEADLSATPDPAPGGTAEPAVRAPGDVEVDASSAGPAPDRRGGADGERWLADRRSTPLERQVFRTSLGWRYDSHARGVARMLAESPGLRVTSSVDETLVTELAAVRAACELDAESWVESVRTGCQEHEKPLAVCLSGGLRRLPTYEGVVLRGGPEQTQLLDHYQVGQELTEVAPLRALDDPETRRSSAVEVLIWAVTARRLTGLVDTSRSNEVMFQPGTVFRVLAVDPADAEPVRRVLLAEVPPGRTRPVETETRIRARLDEAARIRDEQRGDDEIRPALSGFADLPGDPAWFATRPAVVKES